MTEFRYDTYCGLYCGACDIMRACREGGVTGRAPQWADLPARFTGHLPHAEIKCHGCKSDDVFAGCNGCPIRKCARQKGLTGTCADCGKYPCMIWRLFSLVAKLRRLDRKLPHWRIAPRNLKRMKDAGISRWLEEQQAVWQCPDCGTAFSWYRERCAKCGRDVEPLKDYNKIDPAA
jgi:hypothetical protein